MAVQVRSLSFQKKIMIDSIQHFSHLTGAPVYQFTGRKGLLKDGCTIVYQGIYLVLYNVSETNQQRLNWTLAHEIGHIYLDHQTDGALQEVEAHAFASHLLVPGIVLNALQNKGAALTKESVSNIFSISLTAAEKRLATFQKRPDIPFSEEERQLLRAYRPLIDQYIEQQSFCSKADSPIYAEENAAMIEKMTLHWLYDGI